MMKRSFALLIFFGLPLFSMTSALNAQTAAPRYVMLDAKDPLIGDWVFTANDTASPVDPFGNGGWSLIRFSPGTQNSACSTDSSEDFLCPYYFLAFSNGKEIMGTISDGCNKELKGKKMVMKFEYHASEDELVLSSGKSKAYYRRRTGN
jgi:hypothetical protein